MNYFDENISLLRSHDPALARRVINAPLAPEVEIATARNGLPTLKYQSIYLHSGYDPVNEAKRSVSEYVDKSGAPALVYGLGLGYHIAEILNQADGAVVVIEPLMSVFRAFLSAVDLRPFLPRTHFLIAEPAPKILARKQTDFANKFLHKPSLQISQAYFNELERAEEVSKYLTSHRMRILVVNPIYGGSLPTAKFCVTALENLGHEAASVNCDHFADSFFSVDKVTRNKDNKEVLSNLFMRFMGEVIIAKTVDFQPDLILALAQAPMTGETLSRLKTLGIPIAFWFVEDFRALTYWKDIAAQYDYIFALQKDDFFDELKARDIKNHYYLPQACLSALHKQHDLSVVEREIYASDLSFMGAAYYNRVQSFPQLLDFDFKIWGSGWEVNSILGPCLQKNSERVSSEECVKIYNGAKVNLNLHSSSFHESVNPNGDFVNPRTLEIAACGAFQLVDKREELDDMFRVGEELIDFDSMEDLKEKISYYLSHEDERKTIAAKGQARVLKEHTMEHRMKELLIRIYLDHYEKLKLRLENRKPTLNLFIDQAGSDTELGRYLTQLKDVKEFSLKTVVDHIAKGNGALTKNELLLLMLDQVVMEGGKE